MIGIHAVAVPTVVADLRPFVWVDAAHDVWVGNRRQSRTASAAALLFAARRAPITAAGMIRVDADNPAVFDPAFRLNAAFTVMAVWVPSGHPISLANSGRFAAGGWSEPIGADLPVPLAVPAEAAAQPVLILCVERSGATTGYRLLAPQRQWTWQTTTAAGTLLPDLGTAPRSLGVRGVDVGELLVWNDRRLPDTARDNALHYLYGRWFARNRVAAPPAAPTAAVAVRRVMDLGTSTTAQWTDITGNGFHGQYVGGVLTTTRFGGGYLTPANQTARYVALPIAALRALPDPNRWSLITWLEFLSVPAPTSMGTFFHNMSASAPPNSSDFYVHLSQDRTFRVNAAMPALPYDLNQPLMVTIVRDGTEIRLYRGNDPTPASAPHPLNTTSIAAWILNQEIDVVPINPSVSFDPTQACHANWFRITLYDAALTAEQIAAYYELTKAPFV